MTSIIAPTIPPGTRAIEPYYWRPFSYPPTRTVVMNQPPANISITLETPKPPEVTVPGISPATTASAWMDQELISGVKNKWLALGGAIAAVLYLGRRR